MYARKKWRLSAMMALVYGVQGAFWPLLAVHLRDLGIDGRGRGWIFATLAFGSFAMPLGIGQLLDRLMPAQRFLTLVYALGTVFLLVFASGVTTEPAALFGLFLAYWLLTAPATGMSNAIALRHLARPLEEFSGVRLWGTMGWMTIGWVVSLVMAACGTSAAGQGTYEAFAVAAVLSVGLAAYSLVLPHTPPLATDKGRGTVLRDALALIARRDIAIFLATSFGVCLTTPFVYQVLPTYLEARGMTRAWIPTAMTLGQVSEVACLAALPWMFGRFNYKGTLALGIITWGLRYATLVFDPPLWVTLVGIPLHGIGVACVVVGGQVFIDSRAPEHRRAGAQAILMVLTSGLGSLLGSVMAGELSSRFGNGSAQIFLVPCLINLSLLGFFLAAFRPQPVLTARPGLRNTPNPPSEPTRSDGGRVWESLPIGSRERLTTPA
ncbi:MFS transporter [Singulisphaera rosea]